MTKEINREKSLGSGTVNHFSSRVVEVMPKGIDVVRSLEEAIKLDLGLCRPLIHMNGCDRASTAVNLCIYTEGNGSFTAN